MQTLFYLIYACIVALFILNVVQSIAINKLREQYRDQLEFNRKLKLLAEKEIG
jgi:hypothetical protein